MPQKTSTTSSASPKIAYGEHEDLIVAQASAHGTSRRGIVRLSGQNALETVALIFRPTGKKVKTTPLSTAQNCSSRSLNDFPSKLVSTSPFFQRPRIVSGMIFPWSCPTGSDSPVDATSPANSTSPANAISAADSADSSALTDPTAPDDLSTNPILKGANVGGGFLAQDADLGVPCDLYYWPEHRGFTGQASIELHLPGNPLLLELVVQAVCSSGHARLAQPGEFTLRAFLSGRIDLTQAEAVLGVIDASSDREMTTALEQLAGGIGKPLFRLQETLFQIVCDLEAGLDFSEEEIEFISRNELTQKIQLAVEQLQSLWEQLDSRAGTNEKPRVVLSGRSNTGKSALYNCLIQRPNARTQTPTALVSEWAGTTRDYLESELALDHLTVLLVDTAGIDDEAVPRDCRRSSQPEYQSLKMSEQAQGRGELLLFCVESDRWRKIGQTLSLGVNSSQKNDSQNVDTVPKLLFEILDKAFQDSEAQSVDFLTPYLNRWEQRFLWSGLKNRQILFVVTKSDLDAATSSLPTNQKSGEALPDLSKSGAATSENRNAKSPLTESSPLAAIIETSSLTKEGVDALTSAICRFFRGEERRAEVVASTSLRCRDSLRMTMESLQRVLQLVQNVQDDVLIAAEIRVALNQLGLILGTVHTEDILDRIFSRFCIGK